MAKNVTVSLVGGTPKVINVDTAGEALVAVGADPKQHVILVNGEASEATRTLADYDFVSASLAVKGN